MQGQPDEKHLTARALVSKNITVDVHGAVARALAFQYGLSSRTGVDALLGFAFDSLLCSERFFPHVLPFFPSTQEPNLRKQ